MVGLSLSLCVRDILIGRVSEDEVEYILAAARPEVLTHPGSLASYKRVYWDQNPEEGEAIANRLNQAGKIRWNQHGVDREHGYWQ